MHDCWLLLPRLCDSRRLALGAMVTLHRQLRPLVNPGSTTRGVAMQAVGSLISLEDSDQIFGERIHDLRAHGWAWLGNAHRLIRPSSSSQRRSCMMVSTSKQSQAPPSVAAPGSID